MALILHLDMDAFFAAVEERDNPQFRGKPIVVGASPNGGLGRGVVSTANYEARKYGIHSAMPISWAYRACPTAIFLPVDMKRYVAVSSRIMAIMRKYGRKMEQVSVDEAYLELKTTSYNKAHEIAKKIKQEIWEKKKLTCSIGIGPNKLIAKICSDFKKPDGLTIVPPREVRKFLDPMTVRVIPGIGPKTEKALGEWKIGKIKDLRKTGKRKLVQRFGVRGEDMWNLARGIDGRIVEEGKEAKSVGRQITFEKDTKQSGPVIETAFGLLEEIFNELKEEGLSGKTITVVVRYAWFETHTSQETSSKVLNLKDAKKLCLKLLLPYFDGKPVRLVGVRISGFD